MLIFSLCFLSSYHVFSPKDSIIAYANKIGPEDNLITSYFPSTFCLFDSKKNLKSRRNINDIFFGNEHLDIGLHFQFQTNSKKTPFVELTLNADQRKELQEAITNNYLVELSIDQIITHYHLGSVSENEAKIFGNIQFIIFHNKGQIIEVQISEEKPIDISTSKPLKLTFSVTWKETDSIKRVSQNSNPLFFRHPIHKYSVINSGLLSILLILLVILLYNNIISADTNRRIQEAAFDGFEVDVNIEKGWKALHGDVFRPPSYLTILSMICGSGIHFLIFSLVYFIFNSIDLNESLFTYGLVIYILTSPLSGFATVSFAKAFGLTKWLRLAFGSCLLFPIFYLFLTIIMNVVCSSSGFSSSFTILYLLILVFCLFVFVLPLSGFGGYLAIKAKLFDQNKCQVALIARHITKPPFYYRPLFLAGVSGLVCASSIIVEVYYILSSISHMVGNYLWSYLAIFGVLFLIVTSCVSILSTYLVLQSENHKWQWPAFASTASTSVYIFLYSFVYMISKTNIDSLSQVIIYLIYAIALSVVIGLVGGGSGYFASNVFVHSIFANLKLD